MHLNAAFYTLLLISWYDFEFSSATSSSITATNFLKDPNTLVSSNGNFVLGFFTPINSTNRYLGISFNNKSNSDGTLEVIWVANRDNPLKDSSGVLKISDDWNLKLVDSRNNSIWTSNISYKVSSSIAQLDNTGDLILFTNGRGETIWKSFDDSTNSVLPGQRLTLIKSINANTYASWKSSTDPSKGKYRIISLPRSLPEMAIVDVDADKVYWRSGPWNGYLFLGMPDFRTQSYVRFIIVDHDNSTDATYKAEDQSLLQRYVLDSDGSFKLKYWNVSDRKWEVLWDSLASGCDVYGKCGKFAVCDAKKAPICECLKGFKPEKVDEWMNGNWTNGCVRGTPLHECRAKGGKDDRFLQLKQMKVPDYATWFEPNDADVCESMCLSNCSCLAYTKYDSIGCMFWNGSLVDIQQFFGDGNGADLFICLAYSELPGEGGTSKKRIAVIAILSTIVFGCLMYFLWRLISRKYGRNRGITAAKDEKSRSIFGKQMGAGDFHDLPLFEFTTLTTATDNFSMINKLGQGGFGPVYKGILEGGQEIAVKRLSRVSGQGLQEFMNEVVVISKLQHKNLVKLLGCCVDGEEKLLVYEFMPNKSLDAILFDNVQCKRLDWPKRFEIIQGICRGLLYLHRDSRLRIIHRDLKPSNILLDEELNPKISDFGTARIFGSKQDEAETLRVVGTYGYMSPEYAMEGRFSEKSDVYSLGVLLVEIAIGRRNNFQENVSLSLLAYAWKLWNDNDLISLVDPAVGQPSFEGQILKCIQVGLLCVQEYAKDRPNVSELISMLEVDDVGNLPSPKKPGFARAEDGTTNVTLPMLPEHYSGNGVSLTALSAR